MSIVLHILAGIGTITSLYAIYILFIMIKQNIERWYKNRPRERARTRDKYEIGDLIWRPMYENNTSWYSPGTILNITPHGRWEEIAEIEHQPQKDGPIVKETINIDLLRRRKKDNGEYDWIKAYVEFQRTNKEKMTTEQKLEILDMIYENAFYISFNMNDTWGWATSDSGSVEVDDLPTVYELYKKYGSEAITAYVAIDEGIEPMPEWMELYGEKYTQAKNELLKLQADKKILV